MPSEIFLTEVTERTKKPTGLSITRSQNKFKISWKIGDKNYGGGQVLKWKTNQSSKWNTIKLGPKITSKTIELNFANYIPATEKALSYLRVEVEGLRDNYTTGSGKKKCTHIMKWSDSSMVIYYTEIPNAPKVTVELDDELNNRCKFTWTTATSDTSKKIFRATEWQSVLLKNSNITDGAEAFKATRVAGTYETGTSTANNSKTFTEDTSYINKSDSYTRWFRIRARGPKGSSSWVYKKHVYARAYAATDVEAKALWIESGFRIDMTWQSSRNNHRPVDKIMIQYLDAIPGAGMAPPAGATWTDVMSVAYKDGSDGARFVFDEGLEDDHCLFVRVVTVHDREETPSEAAIAIYGKLADPELNSVTPVVETHRATINAENKSSVPGSFLAVLFKSDEFPDEEICVGIITGTSTTVQCPDWGTHNVAFGVRACVGEYSPQTRDDGVTAYSVSTIGGMASNPVWDNGQVPVAPDGVSVTRTNTPGTVRVKWNNTWTEADSVELAWADHEDAWESTDPPSTYSVSNAYAAAWNIANLEVGRRWYFRVRLVKGAGESATPGPWSEIVSISLSEAPAIPALALSQPAIPADGVVTASWGYVSGDGTPQAYAEICTSEIVSGEIVYGEIIATVTTPQHIDLYAEELGWAVGDIYNLCVRVGSASGEVSEWSEPNSLMIVPPIEIAITQTSLQNVTVVIDDVTQETETVLSLTDMPFTCTVTGAGDTGTTTVAIERAETYYLDRPDERTFTGHEGETIALFSQMGEAQITISNEDLIGSLDDGAPYRLVATVQDGFGQSAEASIEFAVHWTHQAVMPEALVEIDNTDYIAKITPIAPTGAEEGDVCDIYRLSVDRPELIYAGAEFGTTYVDPFPALGEMGGHRIVFRTANGDYITEDNEIAWTDYTQADTGGIDTMFNIIDYENGQVQLMYDITLSNGWDKDFQETKYLGGHIQGDWNPAVSRSGNVGGAVATVKDQETIQAMRRLADSAGICHVRTRDGSSYAADVQVSESRDMGQDVVRAEFTLNITRVDPEGYEAMTLADWTREED